MTHNPSMSLVNHNTVLTAANAKVAVVNNTGALRRMLTEALERQGVSAIPYENGEALLKDARLRDFQVVVADWANSPLSGRGLWDALTAEGYPGRVVFVSGRADEIADTFAGADLGPADIIDLPAAMPKVAARIVSQFSR